MRKQLALVLIVILCTLVWLPALQAEDNDNDDLDRSKIRPSLIIESISTEEAVAGGEFYISLVVKNDSTSPALNVTTSLKVKDEDGMYPFFYKEGEPPTLERIEGGESRTITIGLRVDPEARAKDYQLEISVTGENVLFEQAARAGAQLTIPVEYDMTIPQLLLTNVRLDPRDPEPGQPFTASFYFENVSRVDAHNLVATLEGLDNFTLLDASNKKALSHPIPGGRVGSPITYNLQARETREGNQVEIKLEYSFRGNQREEQVERITLPLDRETGTRPRLELSNLSTRQLAPGQEFLLTFELTNRGDREARDIKLSLDGQGSILPVNSPSINHLEPLAGGESRKVEFRLGLNRTDSSVYALDLDLEYRDRQGQEYVSQQTFGLTGTDIGATRSTPWVIISKYTLSPEQVFGGNVVSLGLSIENTNPEPVRNVKISLGVVRLEGERGDTVFSPIDSSNSFYLDSISPRGTVTKEIDLFVDPNAAAQTYIVPVTIDYEDASGNSKQVEELVTIPVTQEARLEVISLEVPPHAMAGQPIPIGAEFVNVGKVTLGNFMVTVEGDFPKENASYYVGNLEPGMVDFFQGMAIPQQEGILEGELVFSYIDNNNQEVEVREPFSMTVDPMMREPMDEEPPEGRPGREIPGPGTGTLPMGRSLLFLGLLAIGAVVYVRRERAKKRNGEFFYE